MHSPRRPCWTAPWATPPPAASLPGMPVGLSRGAAWMAKNGPEPVRGWRFWTILPKTALCRPVLNPSGAERRRRQGVQICPLCICRLAARHPLGDVPGRCRRHPPAGPLPVGNSRALGADWRQLDLPQALTIFAGQSFGTEVPHMEFATARVSGERSRDLWHTLFIRPSATANCQQQFPSRNGHSSSV